MATIRQRLLYAIGVEVDGAKKGLKDFRSSVLEAEGGTAKLKAGFASAKESIVANAGLIAVGVGTAIVTAGIKASQQFTKLALDVEKFSVATGLSTEAASRWVEVAGDLNITTEQIQGGFVKLEKAIGGNIPAVDELGISLATAADGSTDVSATMINAIRALEGVEDPARKAKLASDLFGRGFADMAELVTGDADEIVTALGKVSDAKIIDAEEIAKAKKNRETLNELKDSFEDLSLVIGESFLPVIAGAAEGLGALAVAAEAVHLDDIVGAFDDFDDLGTGIGRALRAPFDQAAQANHELAAAFGRSEDAARDFDRTQIRGLRTFDEVRAKVLELTDSEHAANLVALEWAETNKEAAGSVDDLAEATGGFAEMSSAADKAAMQHKDSVDEVRRALFRQEETLSATTVAAELQAEADEEAAEQAERHAVTLERIREVTEALADAEERRLGIVNESLGGAIRAEQAQRDARDSLFEYTEQIKAHNEAAPEFKLNQDQINALTAETTLEQLAAADAAAQYRIDQAEAAGATVTNADEQRILREELANLVETLNGPVRDAVLQAIADMDALAKDRFFTIHGNVVIDAPGRVGDFAAPEVGGQFALNPAPAAAGAPRTINNNFYVQNLDPAKVIDATRRYDRFNPS